MCMMHICIACNNFKYLVWTRFTYFSHLLRTKLKMSSETNYCLHKRLSRIVNKQE